MSLSPEQLEKKARWVRRLVLERVAATGKGHIGGTYSCVELLVALYYGGILNVDPSNPSWAERDRFLIGKGHACLALFAILSDLGFMPAERLMEYGEDGGLGGQLDTTVPGVEYNTGSLGHVLGIASGIALAAKIDARGYRAFALMGDAECYEGSVWESLIFSGHHKLNHLVGIIDRNRLSVTEILDDDSFFKDFREKLRALDWDCYEIDGHALDEILGAFRSAGNSHKPVMIIANTIKGKGISFMENVLKWHHGTPNPSELEVARRELGALD